MLRISPASDRLAVRFLRRGVPPPQLQRLASRIRPLIAVAPARGLTSKSTADLRNTLRRRRVGAWSVSYTHLTLPTKA